MPGGEILTITLHPSYLHIKRIAPGQRFFVHEIYIPRRKLIPILRWLLQASRKVPATRSFYPPEAARLHYQEIEAVEQSLRQAKRQRAKRDLAHSQRAAQKKRYLRAKRKRLQLG
jgi:hypothetical protein